MLSANIPNSIRKSIYRRDGYRCALCDSPKYLQIHHAIPRSVGGSDHPHNLICLCSECHALAHGAKMYEGCMNAMEVEQACIEYLADMYAGEWYPYK